MPIITNTSETVKQVFQDVDEKIIQLGQRLDEKIDALRAELTLTRQATDDKFSALSRRLDEALDIRERLAILEAKLAASPNR